MSRPAPEPPLVDRFGRVVDDLRVSVTDLCNLRCQYCMPADGVPWLPRDQILTFEEITRLVGILAGLGVRALRLTGGEPLVRRGFPDLVRMIAAVPGIEDLSLTTNGLLLERHAAALVDTGIRRFNVSLDALDPDRFEEVTRRREVDRVLAGLHALRTTPGVGTIKVNAVSIRGITEHEAPRLVDFARAHDLQVRFIEQMPLGAVPRWARDDVLTGAEVRAVIERHHRLVPRERAPHATARVFGLEDGRGEVAFINPVTEPFCADCNRIRLTADGQLRTCLFSRRETDLRRMVRTGATDAQIAATVRSAVHDKEAGHGMDEPGFLRPPRVMSQIGG